MTTVGATRSTFNPPTVSLAVLPALSDAQTRHRLVGAARRDRLVRRAGRDAREARLVCALEVHRDRVLVPAGSVRARRRRAGDRRLRLVDLHDDRAVCLLVAGVVDAPVLERRACRRRST